MDEILKKNYRKNLGFTNQTKLRSFFDSKDIVRDADYNYLNKLNQRLENIIRSIHGAVIEDIKIDNLEEFIQENVYNVFEAYFSAFSYYRGENRDKMMPHANDAVDVLFKKWYDLLESNRDPILYTYNVDCYKEQGFYVNDYEQFGDLLDGTSFDKTKVNLDYLEEKDRWIESTYDNSQRLRLLNEFLPVQNTSIQ